MMQEKVVQVVVLKQDHLEKKPTFLLDISIFQKYWKLLFIMDMIHILIKLLV